MFCTFMLLCNSGNPPLLSFCNKTTAALSTYLEETQRKEFILLVMCSYWHNKYITLLYTKLLKNSL